jgi:4-amino-4-deoxy-L-arabinose transferase-like glycosyltransferase
MIDSAERGWRATLVRLAPWLLVGGLVLFHGVSNWIWLTENVTSTGWDKPRHLARSLHYTEMLSPITIRSLFEVTISDPVRPPLFPASAGIMYKLFGRSDDVATMVNVIYLTIALAATYGLGQRWGGRRLGLISVLLLACFPMFYAMSRYFYLEFALTAMVTLTVFLLMATDGFQRRGVSLLFGLSLGLGLLTKRTFVAFTFGPVIVAILASGLLPALWQRLKQRPHVYWKNALLALVGGLAVAALWYLPNRETVHNLILGDALFVVWWMLAALTLYFATLPSAPLANALSAVFLAAGLASNWYLARIEFLQRVALYGYGIDDPRGRALQLDNLDTYLYYVRKLVNEHLSPIPFLVLLVVLIVAVVVTVRRQGSVQRALRQIRPEGWAVLAWAGGGYAVLTLSIYQETRALIPVLPALALLFGAALLKLPWRRVRWGLLVLLVAFGLLQFWVVSYEPLYQLLPPRRLDLPFWGRTSLLAQGTYIQLPDEDKTDRGYWIHPDILQRMEQRRQLLGYESVSLGMLVNTTQINAGPFNYLILTEYPHLSVESLIVRFDETSPYRRLFAHDFVAVKRINAGINPSQEKLIQDILDAPPELFAQVFELESAYPLPDGDTVHLYRQRNPLPADYPVEYVTDLAGSLGDRTRAGDAILLTPPGLASPFVAHYSGAAEIYLAPATEEELADIAAQHGRIFLVLGDEAAGEVQGLAQEWLNRHGFRAAHEWAGSLQLLTYGTVAGAPATAPTVEVQAELGGQIELVGYDLPVASWKPGDILPMTLFWQRQTTIGEDYNVFVHLFDSEGTLVAQTDSAPVGGSRPTSGWGEEELIVDRHGLFLPDMLPPGEYELLVGLYHPATSERLSVLSVDGEPLGDGLSLGRVAVTSP